MFHHLIMITYCDNEFVKTNLFMIGLRAWQMNFQGPDKVRKMCEKVKLNTDSHSRNSEGIWSQYLVFTLYGLMS